MNVVCCRLLSNLARQALLNEPVWLHPPANRISWTKAQVQDLLIARSEKKWNCPINKSTFQYLVSNYPLYQLFECTHLLFKPKDEIIYFEQALMKKDKASLVKEDKASLVKEAEGSLVKEDEASLYPYPSLPLLQLAIEEPKFWKFAVSQFLLKYNNKASVGDNLRHWLRMSELQTAIFFLKNSDLGTCFNTAYRKEEILKKVNLFKEYGLNVDSLCIQSKFDIHSEKLLRTHIETLISLNLMPLKLSKIFCNHLDFQIWTRQMKKRLDSAEKIAEFLGDDSERWRTFVIDHYLIRQKTAIKLPKLIMDNLLNFLNSKEKGTTTLQTLCWDIQRHCC